LSYSVVKYIILCMVAHMVRSTAMLKLKEHELQSDITFYVTFGFLVLVPRPNVEQSMAVIGISSLFLVTLCLFLADISSMSCSRLRSTVGITSVLGQHTFPVLRSTCS